ncbi:MAG: prepilin-type N-terminal cleavage/methylation domain-containing protein [Phycisphaerae bacterium]|nr:prepilin-type N-terminal cleavage/methylation domain-containing protein [Phycisphaerae bacterium]
MKATSDPPTESSLVGVNAAKAAFTLIEVLVVVAIIALLLAVLLPSLTKAREQSRRAVCATQIKQFVNGMVMYGSDSRDSLPGPIHPAMELETFLKIASNDYEEWHLPYLIRKYFTDKGRSGKATDTVAKCPTAFAMSKNKLANTYGRTDFERPFSYALNNWRKAGSVEFGTAPPWYFGYPDNFWENTRAPFTPRSSTDPAFLRDAVPKKIQVVKQPGREWAIADAFRYPELLPIPVGSTRRPGQWQRGTYQFSFVTAEGLIPDKPYHDGGANYAMFDGHVEYQRNWLGTVNPAP